MPNGGPSSFSSTGTGGFYLGRGEKEVESPLLRASRAQKRDIVQPALIQALVKGGNADFQIFTLHALAKLRERPPKYPKGGCSQVRVLSRLIVSRGVVVLGNWVLKRQAAPRLGTRRRVQVRPRRRHSYTPANPNPHPRHPGVRHHGRSCSSRSCSPAQSVLWDHVVVQPHRPPPSCRHHTTSTMAARLISKSGELTLTYS